MSNLPTLPIRQTESTPPINSENSGSTLPINQEFSIKNWASHRFELSIDQKTFLIESAEDLLKACLEVTKDALKGLRLSAWILYARELSTDNSVKDAVATQHYSSEAVANTTTHIMDGQNQEICSFQLYNKIPLTEPNVLGAFSGNITFNKALQVSTLTHVLTNIATGLENYRQLHRTERQIFQAILKTVTEFQPNKPLTSATSPHPKLKKIVDGINKATIQLSALVARAYFSGLFATAGTSIASDQINNSVMSEEAHSLDIDNPFTANCITSNGQSVLEFAGMRTTSVTQPTSYLTDVAPLAKTLPFIVMGCVGARFLAERVQGSMRHASVASEVKQCVEEVLCFSKFGAQAIMHEEDFKNIADLIHKRLVVVGQAIPNARFHSEIQRSCQNIFEKSSVTLSLKEKYISLRQERDHALAISPSDVEQAESNSVATDTSIDFLTTQQRLLLNHLLEKTHDPKKITLQNSMQRLAIKRNRGFTYESSRWMENLSHSLARIRGIPGLVSPWEGQSLSKDSTIPINNISNFADGNISVKTTGTLFTPASEIAGTVVPIGFIVSLYLFSSLMRLASISINQARYSDYQKKELIEIISEEVTIAKKQGFSYQACCNRVAEAITCYLKQSTDESIFSNLPDFLKTQKENPAELKAQISQLLIPYFNDDNNSSDELIARPLRIPAIKETLAHHVEKIGQFILREVLRTGFLYMLAEDVVITSQEPISMDIEHQGDFFSNNSTSYPAHFNSTSIREIEPQILRLGKPLTVAPIIAAASILAGTAFLASHMRQQATKERIHNMMWKSEEFPQLLKKALADLPNTES
ncbi:MAG: hypothetical protein V4629_11650 [Pseudomonadota bacterium]